MAHFNPPVNLFTPLPHISRNQGPSHIDVACGPQNAGMGRYPPRMFTSSQPVVLVGVGQMGGVFSKALLTSGHTVVPVTRSSSMENVAATTPDPALVLVTVGEDDLDQVLADVPETWRNRLGLIQNELLPRSWTAHAIENPTVAVVWFEKKPGVDTKVIIPSPIAGPHAPMIVRSLTAVGISARLTDPASLLQDLVAKNLYILVANVAGLETGGTVAELWNSHEQLARSVGDEILQIQEYLLGKPIDPHATYESMLTAFAGDPDHGTTGRSAPKRLKRAIVHAREAGIATPVLNDIARRHDVPV